jgi:hypothetical protein
VPTAAPVSWSPLSGQGKGGGGGKGATVRDDRRGPGGHVWLRAATHLLMRRTGSAVGGVSRLLEKPRGGRSTLRQRLLALLLLLFVHGEVNHLGGFGAGGVRVYSWGVGGDEADMFLHKMVQRSEDCLTLMSRRRVDVSTHEWRNADVCSTKSSGL